MPRRDDLSSICLIGSGPIVIGQACEFDYAGCQALKVLRQDGFRTIVVNSNPATIMTDPGFADRTYLEPLDLEGIASVLERDVERRLPAHRREERVRPLAPQHLGDSFEVERLEVGGVREPGVGHDRRRVRVDDDRPEALFAEHLERLAPGVVELAGLPDHDRPRADQADRGDIVTPRQG